MAVKETKEVAIKEKNEIVDSTLFEGQVTGFEGTTGATFKIPFLKILQALSPELKKSDPKYIEGSGMGDYCNSATGEIYKSIDVIILKVEHSLITWKPNRGGFVGRVNKRHEEEVVTKKDGLQKWDKNGNGVMDTIEFFCMNINNPMDTFIFPVSAASYKHGSKFASRLRALQANGKPVGVTWAGVWKISTTEDKNDKGSWYTLGSTPEFLRFINKDERDNLVSPALEMLKTAETDYSTIENEGGVKEEETEF
jgi:hypothetical protein